jgi:hypothetical protein
MRRALLIFVTVATALVAAGPATASHGRAAPARDYVVGAGTLPGLPSYGFAVNAESGPSGEDPHGHLMIHSLGWVRHADVTCMIVTGSHAQLSGPVTFQNFEDADFLHQNAAVIIVDDMGPPFGDRVTFTTFSEDLFHVNPDTACIVPTTADDPFNGNVIVHDG